MYTYTYAVADDYSGSNFGADEQRDGPVASGSYYVNLPDSRVQKVNTPVILCNFYAQEMFSKFAQTKALLPLRRQLFSRPTVNTPSPTNMLTANEGLHIPDL